MRRLSEGTRHGVLARSFVAVSATLSLVIAIAGGYSFMTYVSAADVGVVNDETWGGGAGPSTSASPGSLPEQLPTTKCIEEACNYLILGSDSRATLTPEEQSQFGTDKEIGGQNRADTIMLVHLDPNLEKAIVLSFPRDLWVYIPSAGRYDKINSAFERGLDDGGPRDVADAIYRLTGLEIQHYLYVDLAGFQGVVDTLGGVDMCIPEYLVNTPGLLTQSSADGTVSMVEYAEPGHIVDLNTGLDILPGCQHLDGTEALAYVRSRHLECDNIPDFSRIGRQQQFLRAVISQMTRPTNFARAPGLLTPVLANMHRDKDFAVGDLIYLLGRLRGLATGNVEFRAIPGFGGLENGVSVVKMDPAAEDIFQAIKDGQPISGVGTELLNTPPSEATISVSVVDAGSTTDATDVVTLLQNSGFAAEPEVVSPESVGLDRRATSVIAYTPGHELEAKVVQKYLPQLTLFPVDSMTGSQVAVVVTPSYEPPGPNDPAAQECIL
jgi:LCP family protein required for cell wall assembly